MLAYKDMKVRRRGLQKKINELNKGDQKRQLRGRQRTIKHERFGLMDWPGWKLTDELCVDHTTT